MISNSQVLLGVGFLVVTAGCGNKPDRDPFTAADPASTSAAATSATPSGTAAKPSEKPPSSGGDMAPTFTLDSMNGAGKLTIEKGKVTIVDFWATWCEPCKKSFPKLQELHVKHKSSGLNVLAISVDDDKKDIPAFIKRYGAKFPVGWDSDHSIAHNYKPETMPSSFVVDKNGKIRFRHVGYHPGEEDELEKEFKQLIAEK